MTQTDTPISSQEALGLARRHIHIIKAYMEEMLEITGPFVGGNGVLPGDPGYIQTQKGPFGDGLLALLNAVIDEEVPAVQRAVSTWARS
jgi:hypothetical protein